MIMAYSLQVNHVRFISSHTFVLIFISSHSFVSSTFTTNFFLNSQGSSNPSLNCLGHFQPSGGFIALIALVVLLFCRFQYTHFF